MAYTLLSRTPWRLHLRYAVAEPQGLQDGFEEKGEPGFLPTDALEYIGAIRSVGIGEIGELRPVENPEKMLEEEIQHELYRRVSAEACAAFPTARCDDIVFIQFFKHRGQDGRIGFQVRRHQDDSLARCVLDGVLYRTTDAGPCLVERIERAAVLPQHSDSIAAFFRREPRMGHDKVLDSVRRAQSLDLLDGLRKREGFTGRGKDNGKVH